MSGSDESNEALVAGRVNRANDQTTIWAENRYDSVSIIGIEVGDFRIAYNGPAILKVEAALDSEDEGEFRPATPLDAIVGVGWSADPAGQKGGTGVVGIGGKVEGTGVSGVGGANATGVVGDAGGRAAGVVGLGGPDEGTGIFGEGSGGERNLGVHLGFDSRRGRGGIGVHGVGGLADLRAAPDVLPGAGVLGQGGKITDQNAERQLLGPGVIGIGGAAGDDDRPTMTDAGSAGVFGQGAEARLERFVDDAGIASFVGPAEAGPGVVGIGGLPNPREFPVGAGVIGLAGGETRPPIDQTGGVGVFGRGPTGVRARGVAGPGIHAHSTNDRAGVFDAENAAQVQLVPQRVRTRFPEGSAVTPTGISAAAVASGVVALPKDGLGGDLVALADVTGRCTLWFCVETSYGAGPAQWAQVLLGPSFAGTS